MRGARAAARRPATPEWWGSRCGGLEAHADSIEAGIKAASSLGPIPRSSCYNLEHRVVVSRFLWHRLKHVPVLDDLAVLVEAEDVDAGVVRKPGPFLTAV